MLGYIADRILTFTQSYTLNKCSPVLKDQEFNRLTIFIPIKVEPNIR